MKKIFLMVLLFLGSTFIFAQDEIKLTGEVFDEYLVPFYGAKVTCNGQKTSTDADGVFTLKTKLPAEISIFADGYQPETVTVETEDQDLGIILKESSKLNEFVKSASRTEERLFESPVSIRRLGLKDIKRSTSENFYTELGNLPGVSSYNNSKPMQILNTRGFTYLKNHRLLQLVDGVDNVVPASSFNYGNMNGAIDVDVESVELLPGASSALYGSNALNGAIIVNTKNPFEYTGITAKATGGITRQNEVGNRAFYNVQARFAHKFDEYLAASASFFSETGEEWHAQDYRNQGSNLEISGNNFDTRPLNNSSYNGINVYGDEAYTSLKVFKYLQFLENYDENNFFQVGQDLQAIIDAPNTVVTRTGYNEIDLVDDKYTNRKFHASLYFRPWKNDKLNIIWRSRFNSTTPFLFQGASLRYQLETDLTHHLLEFQGENFFLRGYYSHTDLNAKSLGALAALIENDHKSNKDWYNTFIAEYDTAVANAIPNPYFYARAQADKDRLEPGTSKFKSRLRYYGNTMLVDGGSRIVDFSDFYHTEGQINLNKYIDWDVVLGGSYRRYKLDSNGSLFSDRSDDLITFYEYGAYGQVKRKFLDDRLSLQASVRFDNTTNYDGQISPRLSLSYTLGEDKNHNVRFTYQTAFRNPAIQDQYYAIQIGNSFTFGNSSANLERLKNNVYGQGVNKQLVADLIKKDGFTLDSYTKFNLAGLNGLTPDGNANSVIDVMADNKDVLKVGNLAEKSLEGERVSSFELGYRGLMNVANRVFEFDVNGYYNEFSNFINQSTVLIPLSKLSDVNGERLVEPISPNKIDNPDYPQYAFMSAISDMARGNAITLSMPTNAEHTVYSYGAVAAIKTKFFGDYDTSLSYSFITQTDDRNTTSIYDQNQFNTPEHTFKLGFGHDKVAKNLGFNINYRWQSEVIWNSPIGKATLAPQNILDAQVSYTVPKMKSRFRLGANNILGKNYLTAAATGSIGSAVFLSWTIND